MKPSLPPQPKQIKAGMDSSAVNRTQETSAPFARGGHSGGHGDVSQSIISPPQQLTPFIERLDAAAVVEGWHNNVLEHIGGVKQANVSGGGLLLATYILQGVSGLLPLQLMRSAEYMESLSQTDIENLLESQPGLAQTLSKSISTDSQGDVALKVVEVAFSWLAYEMQEADGCGRFVAYIAMAVLTLLEMPGLQPPNYELLTTGLPPVLRAAKRMAAGRAIYDCTACVTDRKPIEVVLMVVRRLAEVHQPAASLVCASGLTPFLVKLLSEQDELTTKQALHLIDLQLREQVSFQDVHELYMLDYTTSIPSPHLRTCQLLVGLNTASRLVQILKGTAGSAEPWVTDTAACVLAHIALHKQLHPNLTDAIPAVVAALCKEIDTEEQLCDGDVTCEYVCQPAVEFLAHMASQTANLIDIGLANGIEALARAVAVEPGKQRVTERSILALNLIASGGPSFNNAVARWRNVTNFRNQIDRYVAAQAPLTGPRLDAFITAHQGPLAELDYEDICRQAEADFNAEPGGTASGPSAFVTCAASLTEGGQSTSHADDTRALMTAVLLGGISQDDLTEYMSCFGGLSPVLSNIGHALRLHCGTIVCAPSVSVQDGADHLGLPGSNSREDLADEIGSAQLKGEDSSQHLQVNGGVPALKKRTGVTGNNSLARSGKSGAKVRTQNGVVTQADPDSEAVNMLPTEEELLTCDCPFCVAYRGRSGSVRGASPGSVASCAGKAPAAAGATPSCAGKAPATAVAPGAKPASPLPTAPLKDPLLQGFKATAVIGISCKATPVYRTNDPFTFKINDFKLPSDLVDDIVNKRYPACLAVLITESLELEGLWVPSASPNIKDKDGSDVLQFQRFRVFHPLPKQAHHGILKTLWDKRVQWNQGLNARRTKQLLQAFLDQDVRLGIPSQALPLPTTAPRPAVTAAGASTSAAASAAPAPATAAAPAAAAAAKSPAASPVRTTAAAQAAQSPSRGASSASAMRPVQTGSSAATADVAAATAQSPVLKAVAPEPPSGLPLASTPISKPMHHRKGKDSRAAASRKLALNPGQPQTVPADPALPPSTAQPNFNPLIPNEDQDQSAYGMAYDNAAVEGFVGQTGDDSAHMPGDDLPDLPPLHLSKAQHRSVRTDDGEEVHVLVSPVRSQGGDDSPSSPSRLPDSVLKAMCNMGKAFLSRFTSGPKSTTRNASDDGSLDSPTSTSGGGPASPHWAPIDAGLSRNSAPLPTSTPHAGVASARRSSSMKAGSRSASPPRPDEAPDLSGVEHAEPLLQVAPEAAPKDTLRPAQNGFKPNHRTGSLRPATRSAVKALPLGLHRNPRRVSGQDTARVQAVARYAAAQSVPPGVIELITAAQREIDSASASAEQLIKENDFAEEALDLDFDAFLESDGIAELVAQAQATAGPLPSVQHSPFRPDAHARRARSPAMSQLSAAGTSASKSAQADAAASATPMSPAHSVAPAVSDTASTLSAAPEATARATSAAPAMAVATQPEIAPASSGSAATAAAGTPAPSNGSTTAAVKELPKGSAKQKRAHKNADAIRARLKQRLEAAQEGVSTEDGSSSVTSGLDEEQAYQADMMMYRLVQEEEERLRREEERASKRQQKSAESAQVPAAEADPTDTVDAQEQLQQQQQQQQQASMSAAAVANGVSAKAARNSSVAQDAAEAEQVQQHQQHQPSRLQVPAAPAAKLTKAQRQRRKRLAKQALSVEQSALSAPGDFSDARYGSPEDTAWETVTKKGSKGNKAAAAAASQAASSAAVAAAASAGPGLQTQTSGLSQSSRAASGVLSAMASQQSGFTAPPPSLRAKSADGLHSDEAQSEVSFVTDAPATTPVASEQRLAQQQVSQPASKAASEADSAVTPLAASAEAGSRAGHFAAAPVAKPSNWAGLLKGHNHQQQHQQQQQPAVMPQLHQQEAVDLVPASVVSDESFPQLAAAASSVPDSLGKSQSALQTRSDAELQSVGSSAFATATAAAHDSRGLLVNGSETRADGASSACSSQDMVTQQLHANAAIWGSSLTPSSLSGISRLQLPQSLQQQPQQQLSGGLFQAPTSAAAPTASSPWDLQPTPQQPPTPNPPPQAPSKPSAVKSSLPVNAQPFVPQAHLPKPFSQGQPSAFQQQINQQPARLLQQSASVAKPTSQQTMTSGQQLLPGHVLSQGERSTVLPQGQVPTALPSSSYTSGFDSGLRPQQMHSLGLNSGPLLEQNGSRQQWGAVNNSANAAAMLQLQQRQRQQQQQQAGMTNRQQPPQQLTDIWSQPSALGLHQNGGSQSSRPFSAQQQPAAAKGKVAGSNGPFAAHQASGSAFHQVPLSQQQQQQYPGLQQRQGRGRAVTNTPHFAGSGAVNGTANGRLSSTGTQSEDDELLSGVFNKVWEDNLQESQDLLGRRSPETSRVHSMTHMHAAPPKDIAAAWNLTPADMHKRVDAAAAFSNNSSYSIGFLNSNGLSGKQTGSRAGGVSQPGQLPQSAGQLPQSGQVSHGFMSHGGGQIPQSAYAAVHAPPFRPGNQGLHQQAPAGLVCPLTKQLMKDPVTAADGHTYERGAIVHWMHANNVSPVTRQALHNKHLTTNVQAKSALNRMKQSERVH